MSSKEILLSWCKDCTKNYPEVEILNFTTSWNDGLAFNALIHSYKPDLFDFEEILSKDPINRLENAFNIVKNYFNIQPNMTAIEIHVKQPDRNKILNFLTVLYEYFNKNDSDYENEHENDKNHDMCEKDLIIKEYQENVEDILIWILGAEEKLNNEQEEENNEESLDTIQQIFQNLDDFTTESKDKQQKIEDILKEGQILIKSKLCNENEIEEIQVQSDLLSQRWEDIKNKIMDKQEKVHNILMSLQKKQLNEFSEWLKVAEDKISQFSEIDENLENVKQQYEEHIKFLNEVKDREPQVNRLKSMLVIIDECENPNFSSENLTDDLLDQLEALAEKWENVCTIVEEREETLNIWIILLEQEEKFNAWVWKIVKRLKDIETATSEGTVGMNFLNNLIKRLDKMKKEVNVHLSYYSEMFNSAQVQLKKINKDSDAAIKIKDKIDLLSKKWNSIIERTYSLSDSIKKMSEIYKNEQNIPKLERRESIRKKNESENSKNSLNKDSKKNLKEELKIDEFYESFNLFIKTIEKYEEVLDINCQNKLEQNSNKEKKYEKERLWEELDLKEKEIYLEEIENDIEVEKLELLNLKKQGEIFIEEMKKSNKDFIEIEKLIKTIEKRWKRLEDILKEKQKKVAAFINLSKLHNECDAINRVLKIHNDRLDNEKTMIKKLNIKQNFTEINKIYEQCKLRNKSMVSQKERVSLIEKNFLEIINQYPELNQELISKDLNYFLKYWEETNKKITDFQLDVESKLKVRKMTKKKEEQLSETYPKLIDVIELLENWLKKTYQVIFLAQINLYWERKNYEDQLKSLKELEKDINNEKSNLNYINETGSQVIQINTDAPWAKSFKNKVVDLNCKWSETIQILTTKIQHLETLQDIVPKINNEINQFNVWFNDTKIFCDETCFLIDLENMDKQIEQYDVLIADINGEVYESVELINQQYKRINEIIKNSEKSLLTSNYSLNEFSNINEDLNLENNKIFKETLTKEVQNVIENWNFIKEKANEKRELLSESLKECTKIKEKVENFDKELKNVSLEKKTFDNLNAYDEYCFNLEIEKVRLIKNLNSFTKMKTNLKNLKGMSKLEENTFLDNMVTKVSILEDKCSHIIEEINSLCNNGALAKKKFIKLTELYNSKIIWLKKLEFITNHSVQDLINVEQICDYLQSLENHLCNKPVDFDEKLVLEISHDLVELCFDATKFVNEQEVDWSRINAEALIRKKQLEDFLKETQKLQEETQNCTKNLEFIDNNLVKFFEKEKFTNGNLSNGHLSNGQSLNDQSSIENLSQDQEKLSLKVFEKKFKNANESLNLINELINKFNLEQKFALVAKHKEQQKYLQSEFNNLDKRFNELKNNQPVELANEIDDLKKVYNELVNRQLTSSETDLVQQKLMEFAQPLQNLETKINNLENSSFTTKNYNKTQNSSENSLNKANLNVIELENEQKNLSFHSQLVSEDKILYSSDYIYNQEPQVIEINFDKNGFLDEQKELFENSVDYPWERCLASNYVPYFKNHELQETYWDHPNMMLLMEDLVEMNGIYYAAYRTSIKLRMIQQSLFLNCIHITNMCKIFDTFDFNNENLISVPEMISVFKRIYEDISNKITPITNFGLMIDLALNWVLNLFDLDRIGYVKLLAFKTSLVCLSRASIEEKYKVLFQLISDSKGYADKQSVGYLLKYLLEIPKLLGDIAAFGGSNFEPSIRSCFEESQNKNQINVKNFLYWLKKEPQSLVWLPLLHRLIIAEGSRHPFKCSVCKAYPIIGFRYKCLKCFNCDICQNCFLLRKPLNGHKNTHPIKEYCYVINSSKKEVSDFSKIVRNKFKSSRKSFKKHFADSYLPVNSMLDNIDSFEEKTLNDKSGVSLLQYSPLSQNRDDVHSKIVVHANKIAEAELKQYKNLQKNGFKTIENYTDEHELIMNYCNILNRSLGSVFSNKFASLNDDLDPVELSLKKNLSSSKKNISNQNNQVDYFDEKLDEHDLIKSYCSSLSNTSKHSELKNIIKNPNQVLDYLSEKSKTELNFLIKQLEKENILLEQDYEELKKQKTDSSFINYKTEKNSFNIDQDFKNSKQYSSKEEILFEKYILKEHSKNLEARMEILEEQNKQLQNQLCRLKLLLDSDSN